MRIYRELEKIEAGDKLSQAEAIVKGVNEYRSKIVEACFGVGVPYHESAFFSAALITLFEDLKAVAKREGDGDDFIDLVHEIINLVRCCTETVTINAKIKRGESEND